MRGQNLATVFGYVAHIYVDFPYDITILQSSRVSIRLYVRTTASLSVQCYFFLNI